MTNAGVEDEIKFGSLTLGCSRLSETDAPVPGQSIFDVADLTTRGQNIVKLVLFQ